MAGRLTTYPAGPAGIFAALINIVSGLDGTLLVSTFGVVLLILLVVYRSPVLWIFPLVSAAIALALAILAVYWLAKANVITLTGMSEGILFRAGDGRGHGLRAVADIQVPGGTAPVRESLRRDVVGMETGFPPSQPPRSP